MTNPWQTVRDEHGGMPTWDELMLYMDRRRAVRAQLERIRTYYRMEG